VKRKFEMPVKPSVGTEGERPPRERRKLSLKFGGDDASNGVEAR
jgi:hypothetical protein